MHNIHKQPLLVAIALALFASSIAAQTAPDAGSLLREAEKQQPRLPPPAPQAMPQVPLAPDANALRVQVKAFRLSGNTLIAESELQAVLAPWIGKESTFTELQQAVNALAEAYRRHGWFARPQLPAQDLADGVVKINIIEGRLGAVRIDDGGKPLRLNRAMVSSTMTARQQPGDPLNLDALERGNAILNDTPGFAVATVLSAGSDTGETDAIVKVQDKPLLAGSALFDNQGARSTGADKLTFNVSLDNPGGAGDQISANGNASEGSRYLKLGYARPFGRDGLRAGINASAMRYQLLGEDFAALNSQGDAKTLGLTASYPLLRSASRNMSLAGAIDRKDYYNEANEIATSEKRIHSALLALNGDLLDGFGKGGMTLWGVNLTAGQVDLSANATNESADQAGPGSAGSYQKLGYSLARLQRMSDQGTLWLSLSGQRANKNLDSSEKFSLGGPSGVRAYPLMEGSGDDGWLATLEARYNLTPDLQLSVFYDHGTITQSHNPDYTGAPLLNQTSLKGAGLGLSWSQPGSFTLRAVWARRIGDNPLASATTGADGDGSLSLNRFWLSAVVFF
ncbi:MAG: ShlB/FhaC/HecB family hemolysin secretion/activation protein [Burkholderiales bacterium]|nr:ShlB/FhaC/HecB family hemolysin secretion/activation protein [Burkholderiales bacterium]